jgi:hypothetical protein
MQRPPVAVGSMKLKHALGQIDTENVDAHDQPPQGS